VTFCVFLCNFCLINYTLQYYRHLTLHLNNIHNFMFILPWLFIHSTSIVRYNSNIIYPVTKTDIYKWNKSYKFFIVLWLTEMQNVSAVIIPVLDSTTHNSGFTRSWLSVAKQKRSLFVFFCRDRPYSRP